jgi:DNA invertase Pin-like site-specific DNA recombinase
MSSGWGGPPAYSAVISARRKRPPRLLRNSLELGIVAKAVPLNNRSVSHLLRALETSKALGIEFVSFSEQMDTSTPAGKMVFTVLGAVAELERSLIVERVRAGVRNARPRGRGWGDRV